MPESNRFSRTSRSLVPAHVKGLRCPGCFTSGASPWRAGELILYSSSSRPRRSVYEPLRILRLS